MFQTNSNLVGLFFCFILAGCAGTPLVVDVSDSIYRGASPTHSPAHRISALVIVNNADDGKVINTSMTSDAGDSIPIKLQTPTRVTVEQDIKRYLEKHLLVDHSAKRSLRVTISKADSYWVLGSAEKASPLLALTLAASDREIGMNLRVLFEIEDSGKVVSSYLYEDKIVIQDKATDEQAVSTSYRKLISAYREKFLVL